MKKLLLLAAAMLLLAPVHARAYSIAYTIDSVDPGLDYSASVTDGTLSVFINTIGANSGSKITGKYWITADAGDADTLEQSALTYSQFLRAVCNDDFVDSADDMTTVKLSVSRPWAYSTGIATWDTDPNTSQSSYIGTLAVDTVYDFYGEFTNLASGYGEASFSLSVPSATPIPGAIWLLGSGLVGLLGLNRRKKN